MTVENPKGEKEVLIDHQSYAAGYRQAIMDTQQSPSFLPIIGTFLVFLILFQFFRVAE